MVCQKMAHRKIVCCNLTAVSHSNLTCSSSLKGWKARGRTGLDLQMDSNISSSSGILTSSLNNASISSLPYRCSASLYLGPGEGGGDVTLFPLDKARSLQTFIAGVNFMSKKQIRLAFLKFTKSGGLV